MGLGYNDDKVKNESNNKDFTNGSSKNVNAGKGVRHVQRHGVFQNPKYKAYKNDLQEKWTYVWHGVDGI